jgi:hypothetical protein
MAKIHSREIGELGPVAFDQAKPAPKVRGLLFLCPVLGLIGLLAVTLSYRLLDDLLMWWVGAAPCLVSYTVTNIAWRKSKRKEDVRSFFPITTWLALACLVVPVLLFLNGALDRSPVEQHHQIVMRTILEHNRRQAFYYLELSSWRPHHSHEKISVSEGKYLDFNVGNPVIVETHKGAFGIPLVVSVHGPE